MANGKVNIDINDEKTFRGYIVAKLEDICDKGKDTDKTIENLDQKIDGLDKKFDTIKNEIMSPETCGVNKIKKTLFGNGEDGLVIEVKKLALSHKIKSGTYGILGGGGMSALLVALYFLLRGHL